MKTTSYLRRFTFVLAACLSVLIAMTVCSFADDSVKYLDENGKEQERGDCFFVKEMNDVTGVTLGYNVDEAWYYLDENKTFSNRLTVANKVHLIIKDGCTLNTESGIRVVSGAEFHIYGQSTGKNKGVINADSSSNAEQAGIGGGDNGQGFVEINGGVIEAKGGEGANGEVYLSAGQKVEKPEDPVRGAEKFLGWKKVLEDGSLDENFYDFDSIVDSSFTLKAVWEHNKHTLKHVDAVASACGQEGHDEYWECLICGHLFADAECKKEVTLGDVTTLVDHKWGAWKPVKDAENNATNYHERVCETDSSHVEKEKHNWDIGVIVSAPTSEREGQTKYTCDTCGETRIVTVPKLEADEHSIMIDTKVEGGSSDAVGGSVSGGKSKGKKARVKR